MRLIGLTLLAATACANVLGIGDVEGPAFSVAISPPSQTATAGTETTFLISTTRMAGAAELLTLSIEGLPPEVQAHLDPSVVTAGSGATLTLRVPVTTGETRMPFTVVVISESSTLSATAGLDVLAPSDFALSIAPSARTLPAGGSVTFEVRTRVVSGRPELITLSVGGLPDGVTGAFHPAQLTAGSTATLTLSAAAAAPAVTGHGFTVLGAASSASHGASGTIDITHDFSLALGPSSRTAPAGGSVTFTVTAAATSGPGQSVTLAVEGLPPGVSGSFEPPAIVGDGASTLTLVIEPSAATGEASIRVRGSAPSGTREASAVLRIGPPLLDNGTFERGDLQGWRSEGALPVAAPAPVHGGAYSAWVGSIYGYSYLEQLIVIPEEGKTTLALWTFLACFDLELDDFQGIGVVTTDFLDGETLFFGCSDEAVWRRAELDLTRFAGQELFLYFDVFDDQDGWDTSMFIDDITITNR